MTETENELKQDTPTEEGPEPPLFPELHPDAMENQTAIQNKYCLWYVKRMGANKHESYEKSIKEIGSFKTVEGFWRIYNHLIRPNDLPVTTDYHLFKAGIKPMWEDDSNRNGGKWMVRLRKGIASKYWEELLLAVIGEQFDVGNEVCGIVISIRYNEDILSLWNRNADNTEATYKIRDILRALLELPPFMVLEYKRHDASMNDNSSFRNTTVWRSNTNRSSTKGSNRDTRRDRDGKDWSRTNANNAWSKEKNRRSKDADEDGWQKQR